LVAGYLDLSLQVFIELEIRAKQRGRGTRVVNDGIGQRVAGFQILID
jgi:hypothetical protein